MYDSRPEPAPRTESRDTRLSARHGGPNAAPRAFLCWPVAGTDRTSRASAVVIALDRRRLILLADDAPGPGRAVIARLASPYASSPLQGVIGTARRLRFGPMEVVVHLARSAPRWLVAALAPWDPERN